ncbi:MAG TPA: ABC transporter permease, partial [Dehalococcoidia bacterium]|nr:ABC transporter permease [Dehalococcoidia bacterium]
IIRRLLALPFMLVGISLLLFLLLFIRPGNAAFANIASIGDFGAQEEIFEEKFGLNRPWYVQYLDWLGNAARGDFGDSLTPPQDGVTEQIQERIWNTVEIGLLTIAISAVIGIGVGALSAVKRNSWVDYLFRVVTIAGISVPNFWTATLLLTLPALWWDWTPFASDWVPFDENPIKNLQIIFWPALILAYSGAAYVARLVRSSMLEVYYSDYVRTARSKGLAERTVVARHVFRNSLIPVITVIGLQVGTILAGVIIVEQIFAIPGLGLMTFQAVVAEDYPLVLGAVMVFATMFIVVTLIVDLLYTVVDPRITYA